jgi:transcriptional regulator of acetoin/glycerol metabolism
MAERRLVQPDPPGELHFYRRLLALRRSASPIEALDALLAATVDLLGVLSAHVLFFESANGRILRRDYIATAIDQALAFTIAERAIACGKVVRWPIEGREIVCAPIEAPHPVAALFVHGASLSDLDCERIELVALEIASIADTLMTHGARPTLEQALDAYRERFIREVIERHDGNMSSAARELDVGRGTLYKFRRKPRG